MASAAPAPAQARWNRGLGVAWLLLCAALAAHVADEALTGFLDVYNPTARAMAQRTFLRPPIFEYEQWLQGLIFGIVGLVALSPLAFLNLRGWRVPGGVFAVLMTLNGVAHIAGTIAGRTFADITFPRPMPGFYSSPALIAASVYVLIQLRRSRRRALPTPPGR